MPSARAASVTSAKFSTVKVALRANTRAIPPPPVKLLRRASGRRMFSRFKSVIFTGSAQLWRKSLQDILERLGVVVDERKGRPRKRMRVGQVVEFRLLRSEMRLVAGVSEPHVEPPKSVLESQLDHAVDDLHSERVFSETRGIEADQHRVKLILPGQAEQHRHGLAVEIADIGRAIA